MLVILLAGLCKSISVRTVMEFGIRAENWYSRNRLDFKLIICVYALIERRRMCRLSGSVRHIQSRRSALVAAQARAHGLYTVAIEPYVVLVCHFNGFTSRNSCTVYMDCYSYTDRGLWKAEQICLISLQFAP